SGKRRALIVFDEFQDVTKVDQLEAVLRAHIQYQGSCAAYVFSGSEPGLMRQLFETKAKPLYGQAEPLREGRHYSCRCSCGGSVVLVDDASEPVAAVDLAPAR